MSNVFDLPIKKRLHVWDAGGDAYALGPRGWLMGNTFCRRFIGSLVADGGVGKTALRVAQLISLATGLPLTGEHIFQRSRTLLVSLEDDEDELRRRVMACCRHHGVPYSSLKGWLFLAAPKGLRLAEVRDGVRVRGELDALIREIIVTHSIDVVCLDPFVKAHGLEENSNDAIDYVCTLCAEIAIDYDCVVDLPHHTAKGTLTAGNGNASRGASAMKDAARLVYTLTPMTADEASQFGVPEAQRRSLIRMDSAKVNITPPATEARWFRLVGVPLGNSTPLYPTGDIVQTVEVWTPPVTWDIDLSLIHRILDEIDAGLPNGSRYSSAGKADDRSAYIAVLKHTPEKSEKQARDMIRTWERNGTLVSIEYHDKSTRKTRKGLVVDPTKRPTMGAPDFAV